MGEAQSSFTSAERARSARSQGARLCARAAAQSVHPPPAFPSHAGDSTVTGGARAAGKAALTRWRGLRPSDIDVVELYDAFTINPILFLEDLGFCAKGEGGAFVAAGASHRAAACAVNTNGGWPVVVSPRHVGLFTIVEAVRQLRGGRGERQVAGLRRSRWRTATAEFSRRRPRSFSARRPRCKGYAPIARATAGHPGV